MNDIYQLFKQDGVGPWLQENGRPNNSRQEFPGGGVVDEMFEMADQAKALKDLIDEMQSEGN